MGHEKITKKCEKNVETFFSQVKVKKLPLFFQLSSGKQSHFIRVRVKTHTHTHTREREKEEEEDEEEEDKEEGRTDHRWRRRSKDESEEEEGWSERFFFVVGCDREVRRYLFHTCSSEIECD